MKIKWIVPVLILAFLSGCGSQSMQKVEIKETAAGYQLIRGGKPYIIKGAGIQGHFDELAECGGNSVRIWGVDQWGHTFSQAEKHGLTVCAGIWMDQERQGFDYSDTAAVRRQFEEIRKAVLEYKDHPNLLLWGIGNELDLNYTDPAVWDAVEEVARFIHEADGNHPTMTVTAFIEKEEVEFIKARCPSIDILGVNCYAALAALPRVIREYEWNGPYLVGEWGTFGHWEVGSTTWNEPIEFTSSEKADLYLEQHKKYITNDTLSLGSYVFLWGFKQERTTTWYSMFLPGGEKTEAVDVMHKVWKREWPANRSPRLDSLRLEGKPAAASIITAPGSEMEAEVFTQDPDGDELELVWEILHETTDKRTGGDEESRPDAVEGLNIRQSGNRLFFTAPAAEGPYRLFVTVLDGERSGAHANIPFFVKSSQ